MNIEKLCKVAVTDSVSVEGKEVRQKTSNPLDALNVPAHNGAVVKNRIVLADNRKLVKSFKEKTSKDRRLFLSRLSDSDRRRFLRQLKDEEERKVDEQQEFDQIDNEVFATLLMNAVASLADSDLDLLSGYTDKVDLPNELVDLALIICDASYNPDTDSEVLSKAMPFLGTNASEISDLINRNFGVDKSNDSRIDIHKRNDSAVVRLSKTENFDENEEIEGAVAEDEDSLYVNEDEIKESEEIEDSLKRIKLISRLVSSRGVDRKVVDSLVAKAQKHYPSLSNDVVRLAVYDSVIDGKFKVQDSTFADTLADQIEESVETEVGEVDLISVLSNALSDFANGNSEKLEQFVHANSVGEVVDLLSEGDETPIDEGEVTLQEKLESDKEGDEEKEENEEDLDKEEDDDFSDFVAEDFDPSRKEDSVRLAKMVLKGKLSQKVRDCICPMLPCIANVHVDEDEYCDCTPYNEVSVVDMPLTRDEYCTLMANNNDVEMATQQLSPFQCEEGVQAEQNGDYITVSCGDESVNLIPVSESVEDIMKQIKSCDSVAKVLMEKCVRVRDAKKVAKMLGRMDFLDNRYYKKHLSDTTYVID